MFTGGPAVGFVAMATGKNAVEAVTMLIVDEARPQLQRGRGGPRAAVAKKAAWALWGTLKTRKRST
jgi:hypothetical protein